MNPGTLSLIDSIGESDIAAATKLTQDILSIAVVMAEDDGAKAKVDASLEALRAGRIGALDLYGEGSRRLAVRSAADVSALKALAARLMPLRQALERHLATLHDMSENRSGDELDRVSRQTLLENRIARFIGIDNGLERCRILLDQLLVSGHLIEDQMALMRDVAVPVGTRSANLSVLSRAGEKASKMGGEIDAACESMLQSGSTRLKRMLEP